MHCRLARNQTVGQTGAKLDYDGIIMIIVMIHFVRAGRAQPFNAQSGPKKP